MLEEGIKLEFEGELRKIPASRLFRDENTEEGKELARFFLVLALVFNDLKGVLFFQKELVERYRAGEEGEKSVHSGEYSGLHIQLTRLLVGIVHEFFEFLKNKKDVLNSKSFQQIIDETDSVTIKDEWNAIVNVALGNSDVIKSEFIRNLMLIRHHVSFHYYQTDKVLEKTFKSFFFDKEKVGINDEAYYYLGENMQKTRFFYADAAAEEYLRVNSDSNEKMNSMSGYSPEMMKVISAMNLTISRLLKTYLKKLPKSKYEK